MSAWVDLARELARLGVAEYRAHRVRKALAFLEAARLKAERDAPALSAKLRQLEINLATLEDADRARAARERHKP